MPKYRGDSYKKKRRNTKPRIGTFKSLHKSFLLFIDSESITIDHDKNQVFDSIKKTGIGVFEIAFKIKK